MRQGDDYSSARVAVPWPLMGFYGDGRIKKARRWARLEAETTCRLFAGLVSLSGRAPPAPGGPVAFSATPGAGSSDSRGEGQVCRFGFPVLRGGQKTC